MREHHTPKHRPTKSDVSRSSAQALKDKARDREALAEVRKWK
jgi:hypothetical protein